MNSEVNITESNRLLDKLARAGSQGPADISVVTSPGAKTSTWAAKVMSNDSYNVYNICIVEIRDAGSEPLEIGDEILAYNLAESFTSQGQLATGTYIVMSKVGSKNIFYAKP
ncbi:MAG: hypothetical protein JW804_08685 [Sedimentisphaerales bacterium]|nr:hypothetical protein [Sedimentisphaerales bacterium]